ncbi:MAG: uppP [Gemmatimonadetes bacterium]|nr:uppP [Gemmatimonadota bacterium]
MTILQALVLGLVQGLSEFLPISSSAHLTLVPWLLGWEDPGLAFDVALHTGTLVAVLWYFRAEWVALARAAIELLRTRTLDTVEKRRVLYLIIATIPGGIAGLLLEKAAESAFRSPAIVATALIVMGVVLWLVDRAASATRPLEQLTLRDSVVIGLAQVFALVPGVSRSGSTITAGRALGFTRESAAVFSFLMSMPIIAAAAILKVPGVLRAGVTAPLVIGVIASAVSGWVAITILLRYVSKHSYGLFAIYRVLVGVAVLLVVYARR